MGSERNTRSSLGRHLAEALRQGTATGHFRILRQDGPKTWYAIAADDVRLGYIQRIGRAGRATGTSLIVSVVNQKPHDLFFYAGRPR
ncbi:MAG: hypothetical protein GY856_03085 [bacterium]|nr:hypothetical protein [bacterium]